MSRMVAKGSLRLATMMAFGLLSACVTPPPPPPPPPPVVAKPAPIPARPTPPDGASATTPVPPLGPDGVRLSVNAHLSSAGTTWNLRSGLNVAALNCLEPQHASILQAYKQLLTKQDRKLAAANKAVEAEFRDRFGAGTYRNQRDVYMTQVYNYFALPPVRERFCAVATEVSNTYLLLPPQDLDGFAAAVLPRLEAVYADFYTRFDAYRLAVADWDLRYGATRPGYVTTASFQPAGPVSPELAPLPNQLQQPLPGQLQGPVSSR